MKEEHSYRAIWQHDWYPLSQLRKAIDDALKLIAAEPGITSVIDMGAGESPYRDLFEKHGLQYRTADISGSPDYIINENGRIAVESASFDAVVSFQVLEHVWDIDAYFAEVRRLLRGNGLCILSTHGSWLYHPHPADYRRWTRAGLEREFESRDFQVQQVVPVVGPLGWMTVLRLIAYVHVLSRVPLLGNLLGKCLSVLCNTKAIIEDWLTPRGIFRENACVYLVVARCNIE